MQQVLFDIFGMPIYGFGTMLFLTFIVCTGLGIRWAGRAGLPKEKIQDLAIALFIAGIVGARIFYMVQYERPWFEFFQIWKGGIVFYGSILGGVLGYILFYRAVLRKYPAFSSWKLADVVAPIICVGLAIGRIGCFLNGCCYGHVACPDCIQVHFPMASSPAREELVERDGLQTSLGFATLPADPADPRSRIAAVEPHSAAAELGLRAGDLITEVNGEPNRPTITFTEKTDVATNLAGELGSLEGVTVETIESESRPVTQVLATVEQGALARATEIVRREQIEPAFGDRLSTLLFDLPKGQTALNLTVERDGETVALGEFTPRTLGVYPTQLYETVSMVLLLLVMLAYYPIRRHDGQLLVILMVGYACHRFINEQLRDDTEPVLLQLTVSQVISVVTLLGAVVLELYLSKTQPPLRRSAGPNEPAHEGAPA